MVEPKEIWLIDKFGYEAMPKNPVRGIPMGMVEFVPKSEFDELARKLAELTGGDNVTRHSGGEGDLNAGIFTEP